MWVCASRTGAETSPASPGLEFMRVDWYRTRRVTSITVKLLSVRPQKQLKCESFAPLRGLQGCISYTAAKAVKVVKLQRLQGCKAFAALQPL